MTIGDGNDEDRPDKPKTFAGRGQSSVLKITEAGMMADNAPLKSPGQHAGKTSASSLAFGDGGFMCRLDEEVRPARARVTTSEAQGVGPSRSRPRCSSTRFSSARVLSQPLLLTPHPPPPSPFWPPAEQPDPERERLDRLDAEADARPLG